MFPTTSPRTALVGLVSVVAATLAAVVSGAPAQAEPDPDKPYLSSIAYSGDGCPLGSVSQTLSPDQTTASFGFDSMVSDRQPETLDYRMAECDVRLAFHAPVGVNHIAVKTDLTGYLEVPARPAVGSASAVISSDDPRYTKEGYSGVSAIQYGPFAADYAKSDYLPITLDISAADADMPVLVTLRLEAKDCCGTPEGTRRATIDSVRLELLTQVAQEIHWDAPTAVAYGSSSRLETSNATSDSGEPVYFDSLTPDVCQISGYPVEYVALMAPGMCALRAKAWPRGLYHAATRDYSFDVYAGPISLTTSATARHILTNRYILSFRAVVQTQVNGAEPGVPVSFTQETLDGPVVRCSATTNADGVAECDSAPVTSYYAWSTTSSASDDTRRGAWYKAVAGAGPRTLPKTVQGQVGDTKFG
jgi:hypothetical protein